MLIDLITARKLLAEGQKIYGYRGGTRTRIYRVGRIYVYSRNFGHEIAHYFEDFDRFEAD